MLIDCGTCVVAGDACNDCVVSVLLGGPEDGQLVSEERRVIGLLAESGLVPPLRLVADESGKMAG
ncbi:MAG: hypothetical protein WBB44_12535 [Candidatus Nanopelagicales bacterium]|nr:hypothetical protein [Candidatus Nanopelagicales bacterium]